jgi:hypothetical protein
VEQIGVVRYRTDKRVEQEREIKTKYKELN